MLSFQGYDRFLVSMYNISHHLFSQGKADYTPIVPPARAIDDAAVCFILEKYEK